MAIAFKKNDSFFAFNRYTTWRKNLIKITVPYDKNYRAKYKISLPCFISDYFST